MTELNTSKCEQTQSGSSARSGGQERTARLNNADHGRLQQSNTGQRALPSHDELAAALGQPGRGALQRGGKFGGGTLSGGHDAVDNLSQSGAGAWQRGNRSRSLLFDRRDGTTGLCGKPSGHGAVATA
ncbi:Uncharacterised protein [Mycobacterium tuberculosis]|nr:Uncharacterised protein [Mycobacterium tuberculosis]CKS02071.1 Uncharacterised protein [Mycobacterium tuberculosis]CNL28829.1 Uncharacterised protein [Mycobacterium tuberculosis]CNL75061.1 Uncharacterised protein [Mycobacterium tuberculosis]CNL96604.1 Uncharacterised protein [Mycobacterium tuberculosis]